MLLGLFYFLAFLAVGKFLPGCKISNSDFNMWMLLPSVGIIVGLLDGCISFIRLRSFSALIAGPVIHTVIMIASWYVAKMIPWTRTVDGNPSENGLIITAVVLGAVVVSGIGGK
jgi:hypothetical protein